MKERNCLIKVPTRVSKSNVFVVFFCLLCTQAFRHFRSHWWGSGQCTYTSGHHGLLGLLYNWVTVPGIFTWGMFFSLILIAHWNDWSTTNEQCFVSGYSVVSRCQCTIKIHFDIGRHRAHSVTNLIKHSMIVIYDSRQISSQSDKQMDDIRYPFQVFKYT